jgi:organic radical activating enzyme
MNLTDLTLKEMLWEITPQCNRFNTEKQCDFCGSAKFLNNSKAVVSDEDILTIAKTIAKYPPKELTLTGGEPSCVKPKILSEVVDILLAADIKLKMVSNGNIFNDAQGLIHSCFESIGISINTKQDIEGFSELNNKQIPNSNYNDLQYRKSKNLNTVMITNFGTHNIWNFSDLAECSKQFDIWQIQLTMGKYQLTKDGIKFLYQQLRDANVKYVLADNLQCGSHGCTAGLRSCSVTYDGKVVACLSERSYYPCGFYKKYGSLLDCSLKTIWENEFKDIRFEPGCRKFCRDFIEYPSADNNIPNIKNKEEESSEECPAGESFVALYGVTVPTYVYGVANPYSKPSDWSKNISPSIAMYAVFTPNAYNIPGSLIKDNFSNWVYITSKDNGDTP